jgi:hypothetical protein
VHHAHTHTSPATTQIRREYLASILEHSLPRLNAYAETAGLYLLAATFWGIVLFLALVDALPS